MLHDEALIDPVAFENEKKSNSKLVIVDVREPEEFEAGHFEGARLIPLGELSSRAEAELSKDSDIVVVCAHGVRSLEGLLALRLMGFERSRSLRGGMSACQHTSSPTLTI
jgi:rhodanese-related sulfurtransferase